MGVTRFEDLIAWQKARQMTKAIYSTTRSGEFQRDFGLSNQIQRASVSVMSNVAEGFERSRPKEFHQALSTAKASCAEVRSLLYVARDAGSLVDSTFEALMDQAMDSANVVGALRASVERRVNKDRTTASPDRRSPRNEATAP
jgi:four helix bundle protein